MRVLAYDNSPAAMYPRIQCTPGEHAPSPSLKHGACPCAGSEHQHFDPPVPRTHHELQWHAHETQNCCSHNHVPRQQLVQQRPLTAKAQGKQRVRFLCHEPTCAESAVVAATSMAAALLVMHQLRLLGDLLARFQVLDAACVASLGCGVNSKSCLQVWRRLHRPYTDRIVAVLQAIERITEAHRLLYSSGFRSGVEDWWTPDVYRPRLRVSHLLAPKENVEDKKRRDNRFEEATTRAAEEMKGTIKETFERLSI